MTAYGAHHKSKNKSMGEHGDGSRAGRVARFPRGSTVAGREFAEGWSRQSPGDSSPSKWRGVGKRRTPDSLQWPKPRFRWLGVGDTSVRFLLRRGNVELASRSQRSDGCWIWVFHLSAVHPKTPGLMRTYLSICVFQSDLVYGSVVVWNSGISAGSRDARWVLSLRRLEFWEHTRVSCCRYLSRNSDSVDLPAE
jgi:hypothetical protein